MALDPDKIAEQIGRRIAELRLEKGWSQQMLADKLKPLTTFQWVSQLEAGQNLTVHTLVKVANALKVTLESLLVAPDPTVKRKGPGRPKGSGAA